MCYLFTNRKVFLYFFCQFFVMIAFGQGMAPKLREAIQKLAADSQMKYASMSLYVVDQRTGKVVLDHNSQQGLVPASTQKIITAASALELLGADFSFQTDLGYDGSISGKVLNGNIYVIGYGDPTLGSDRFSLTDDKTIIEKWINQVTRLNINKVNGNIVCFDKTWSTQTIPGGWTWEDIGNYFGAGSSAINWKENSYDIYLNSGIKEGDKVSIVSFNPAPVGVTFINELSTGKSGSGDNAWIYLPPGSHTGFLRGTIPPGKKSFKISGSFPDPAAQLRTRLMQAFNDRGIEVTERNILASSEAPVLSPIYNQQSPALDSIVFWFLRKSINLYGESLVKTIAFNKAGQGSTQAGMEIIKNFWKERQVDPNSIHILDGSGLSPTNRVTTRSLVSILQYAHQQHWFKIFYDALPLLNGIKMKSGTMTGVKSFAGYINGYSFAFIINNYSGTSSSVTEKMYAVLNTLK